MPEEQRNNVSLHSNCTKTNTCDSQTAGYINLGKLSIKNITIVQNNTAEPNEKHGNETFQIHNISELTNTKKSGSELDKEHEWFLKMVKRAKKRESRKLRKKEINADLILDHAYTLLDIKRIKILKKTKNKDTLEAQRTTVISYNQENGVLEISIANELDTYKIELVNAEMDQYIFRIKSFRVGKGDDINNLLARYVNCTTLLNVNDCNPVTFADDLKTCCYRDALKDNENCNLYANTKAQKNTLKDCIEESVDKEKERKLDTGESESACLSNTVVGIMQNECNEVKRRKVLCVCLQRLTILCITSKTSQSD
ncbi:hypothetical protein BDAP_001319 [Binucleata daphniae]